MRPLYLHTKCHKWLVPGTGGGGGDDNDPDDDSSLLSSSACGATIFVVSLEVAPNTFLDCFS